jgi:hypothetical protein
MHPPSPVRPQPLKYKRYTAAMTLCIAGQTRWPETAEKAFILCTDGRLSAGGGGFDDSASKFHALNYNFCGLMAADDWNMVRLLCRYIQKGMTSRPTDLAELFMSIHGSCDSFASSPMCKPETSSQVLITGFIDGDPVMLMASVCDRQVHVDPLHDIDAVGEGWNAAGMLIKHRGYHPLSLDFSRACYVIYEAKRFSESIDSVGPLTRMRLHLSKNDAGRDEYNWRDFSADALTRLESLRSSFFLQPFQSTENVNESWFDPPVIRVVLGPKRD